MSRRTARILNITVLINRTTDQNIHMDLQGRLRYGDGLDYGVMYGPKHLGFRAMMTIEAIGVFDPV